MEFNIDLTDLLIGVFDIIVGLVGTFVVPKLITFLKEKGLYNLTRSLVKAACTFFGDNMGKEKFEWVLDKLKASKFGKYFDEDKLRAEIQAAYVDLCIELGVTPSPAAQTVGE